MTTILIKAPRLISWQRLLMSSILEIAATPIVAAKKVKPLERILWLQFSMETCMASLTGSPRLVLRGNG